MVDRFLAMNKQVILILVLIGLWQVAGWRPLAAQQRPGMVGDQVSSIENNDKDDNGGTEKEINEPSSRGKNEPKVGERHIQGGSESAEVGRVELSEEQAKNANFDMDVAGPAKINVTLQLSGKIAFNEDAVANVSARYPGVVKAVFKGLGDRVQKGEALALIESSDSLRDYQVNADISGTIIKKEVTIGEVARDDKPIFVVADLTTVWVDFSVFPQDFRRLKLGQVIQINYADNLSVRTKISYVAPFGSENTQSMLARAVVQNPEGLLRPGLFVTGKLSVEQVEAPVAVRLTAIQNVNEKTVVFTAEGSLFEAREVRLGKSDGEYVQVLSGLSAGDRYVAGNSFLLKAELGKNEVQDSD